MNWWEDKHHLSQGIIEITVQELAEELGIKNFRCLRIHGEELFGKETLEMEVKNEDVSGEEWKYSSLHRLPTKVWKKN